MHLLKKILSLLTSLFLLLRPKQWIKNLFLFFPALFSGTLFVGENLIHILSIAIVFSLFSGATYIYNDILDREKDRLHPKKKQRPIASGAIPVHMAYVVMFFIFILVFYALFFWDQKILLLFLFYLIYSFFYSHILKKIVFIDILSLSIGFLLRIWIGAVIVSVEPSLWLISVVFFGSVWFGASKRYQEILLGKEGRSVLKYYNAEFLQTLLFILTIILIVLYGLYVSIERPILPLYCSIPIFSFGILRYFFIVKVSSDRSQSIEDILFSDRYLLFAGGILFLLFLVPFL